MGSDSRFADLAGERKEEAFKVAWASWKSFRKQQSSAWGLCSCGLPIETGVGPDSVTCFWEGEASLIFRVMYFMTLTKLLELLARPPLPQSTHNTEHLTSVVTGISTCCQHRELDYTPWFSAGTQVLSWSWGSFGHCQRCGGSKKKLVSWVPSEEAIRTTHSHLDRLALMFMGWRMHVEAGWPTILISQELRGFQAQWTVCLGKSWIKWSELVTVGGRRHLLQPSRNVVKESDTGKWEPKLSLSFLFYSNSVHPPICSHIHYAPPQWAPWPRR